MDQTARLHPLLKGAVSATGMLETAGNTWKMGLQVDSWQPEAGESSSAALVHPLGSLTGTRAGFISESFL